MDLKQYHQTFGPDAVTEFCAETKISRMQFYQFSNRFERPGVDMAWRMIRSKASRGVLTLEELCPPKETLRRYQREAAARAA